MLTRSGAMLGGSGALGSQSIAQCRAGTQGGEPHLAPRHRPRWAVDSAFAAFVYRALLLCFVETLFRTRFCPFSRTFVITFHHPTLVHLFVFPIGRSREVLFVFVSHEEGWASRPSPSLADALDMSLVLLLSGAVRRRSRLGAQPRLWQCP
jgi:hypothetical protein